MDGHFLLVKRIILGVVILVSILIIGYLVYSFYFKPTANQIQAPKTAEQKLKVLDNLSRNTQASTTVASTEEKMKILESLVAAPDSKARATSSVSSVSTEETADRQEKIKLLESLKNKTQ